MTTYYQSFHNSTNNTLISSELIITDMDKSSKLILAENLRRLMDGHPFLSTQQALAKRSGVAQGTISHMLNVDYPIWPKLDSVETDTVKIFTLTDTIIKVLLDQAIIVLIKFTHRSKTPAAPIFKNQAVSKTPADHLLCVSQDLREAQLTMAKCLNAESR